MLTNVATVLASHSAALLLRQQVYDLAAADHELALTLAGLDEGDDGKAQFAELCVLLARSQRDTNTSPQHLGLVVDAASVAPRDAWAIRSDELGPGPLFMRLPQRTLSSAFWQDAWRMRGNHLLRFVYASHTVSQTRLLPDERAPGVAAGECLQVPTGTSWIAAEVDLAAATGRAGIVDETRLARQLADVVERGNAMHSAVRWPTAQMRHDAWLNRRMAIQVTGVGRLVQERGLDPTRFEGLNEMNELMQRIREMLFSATHRLARRDGIVPALDQADPGRLLPGGRIGEGWAWRWRQALEAAAVRNRNLLAMSPWSVFPPGPADFRYANLLPLLRQADVCSFAEPADIGKWNLNDFKNFHQRAAAVLHQRGAAHQIAVHA